MSRKLKILQFTISAFGLPVLLTLLSSAHLQAQTFDEWFKQNKTQKKYLLAQIAALQTYISGVEKGYRIAKDGLMTISKIKDGEFGLHTLYFNSLETVNPAIKHYSKVGGIMQMEDNADAIRKKYMQEASASNMFSASELKALQSIDNNIAADEAKDLEELKLLITDDSLKMTDDERIKNIDKLYGSIKKKYAGVLGLASNIHTLVAGRKEKQKDALMLQQLYGW